MIWLAAEWDGRKKMRRWRGFGLWLLWGLWCLPLRAEVKVIPVFETQAAVQTLKDLYPELG